MTVAIPPRPRPRPRLRHMPNPARHLSLGFVPLIDSAPLLVAHDCGFFADAGLQVDLSREPSWAGIRDRTAFGVLDAAPMTAPMPLAATLGISGPTRPMLTALVLSKGGNGITLSTDLANAADERGLAAVVAKRRQADQPPLTLGIVFGVSTHHYELRAWLAEQGVDPDTDVQLRVVAPPAMAGALRDGSLDGYCVGAPWNTVAAEAGIGRTVAHTASPPPGSPEKVLGVNEAWARANPEAHAGLISALAWACRWLGDAANRREAAELLARPDRLNLSAAALLPDLLRRHADDTWFIDFGPAGHRPDLRDAVGLLEAMRRAGQLSAGADPCAAEEVWRTDLFDAAAICI